jgi:hypothetical protein
MISSRYNHNPSDFRFERIQSRDMASRDWDRSEEHQSLFRSVACKALGFAVIFLSAGFLLIGPFLRLFFKG